MIVIRAWGVDIDRPIVLAASRMVRASVLLSPSGGPSGRSWRASAKEDADGAVAHLLAVVMERKDVDRGVSLVCNTARREGKWSSW